MTSDREPSGPDSSTDRPAMLALVWSLIFAPVGLFLSVIALRKIRQGTATGRGLAQAAFWNSLTGLITGAILIWAFLWFATEFIYI